MGLNNVQIAMLLLIILALIAVYFGVIRPGLDGNDET